MTVDDLKAFRDRSKLTQRDMADLMGLGLSAYQDIETELSKFKPRHQLALERASLRLACERQDINLALPAIRRDALDFATMVRGTEGDAVREATLASHRGPQVIDGGTF